MKESRIDSIRYSSAPARKKPQAGDERYIGGVLHIRQQQRVPAGLPHAGAYMVNGNKPVWEWVEKGGDRDRTAPKVKP